MSTISAGTTSTTTLVATGDTTGSLVFKTNDTGSGGTTAMTIGTDQVVNFAKQPTGTFAGTGPAFSAYASATTSLSNATWTKVLLATEVFDTNNNFASSTFTPTVAGYYQINANVSFPVATGLRIALYKNGSAYCYTSGDGTSGVLDGYGCISALIYCNGSTDYVELYAYSNGNGTTTVNSGIANTLMSGSLVRST